MGLVSGTTLGITTETFQYNTFGEPTHHTAQVNGVNVFDVQITRDNLGRITQRIETVDGITRVFEYGYDLAGRLWQVLRNGTLVGRYIYDSNGNRIEVQGELGGITATYDAQDRLLTYGNASYTYTANGELAAKTVAGQTTSYVYDTLGNLMQVTKPNGDVISYTVDGRGRRVGKSINGIRVKGWLYADQLRPIAELDGDGNLVSRFVYGAKPNVPEYIIKHGETYRVFSDHLGTPRVVVHATTGVVVQRLDVQPFGEIIQDSNPGWQPFGFAGGLYDPDTGLIRFGARDYVPELGRWMAKDPSTFSSGDTGFFAYSHSDPLNLIDPSGHVAFAVLAAGGVIGAAANGVAKVVSNVADGRPTFEGVGESLVSGAISGALGSVAGPIGGSLARWVGRSSTGLLSKGAAAVWSGASSSTGQAVADPCPSGIMNAGFWGVVGGAASSVIRVPGMRTMAEAEFFAPQNFKSLLTPHFAPFWTATSASLGVGAASTFGGPFE